jgi:hypothetical protein
MTLLGIVNVTLGHFFASNGRRGLVLNGYFAAIYCVFIE